MFDQLVEALRKGQVLLFVGAGVSRHLGLPSWQGLIAEMAAQLGYDPRVLASHGDYLELAEFYQLKMATLGPLRSWMDRTWHVAPERVDKSPVHQALVDLNIKTIYTTNYDRWLELAHERRNVPFVKI